MNSARDASILCYNSFNGNTRNVCVAKKRFLEIRPRTHSPSRGHFRLAENAGLKDFPARSAPPRRLIFSHQEALKQKCSTSCQKITICKQGDLQAITICSAPCQEMARPLSIKSEAGQFFPRSMYSKKAFFCEKEELQTISLNIDFLVF